MKSTNTKGSSSVKKTVIISVVFICFLLVCFFGGYFTGKLMKNFDNLNLDFSAFWESFNLTAAYTLPWVYLGLWVAVTLFSIICIVKGKKTFATWNGEDEKTIEKSETLLGAAVCVLNVAYILYLFLFGAIIYFDRVSDGPLSKLVMILFAILYIASIASSFILQRIVIEVEKQINPEKKGELMSPKFHKDWVGSFDEAEKMMLYKASYKAHRATNTLCMILWLVSIIGIAAFETGLLPIAIVTAIWLTSSIAYFAECIKLEKKK